MTGSARVEFVMEKWHWDMLFSEFSLVSIIPPWISMLIFRLRDK
jgi:hypothetical protein